MCQDSRHTRLYQDFLDGGRCVGAWLVPSLGQCWLLVPDRGGGQAHSAMAGCFLGFSEILATEKSEADDLDLEAGGDIQ